MGVLWDLAMAPVWATPGLPLLLSGRGWPYVWGIVALTAVGAFLFGLSMYAFATSEAGGRAARDHKLINSGPHPPFGVLPTRVGMFGPGGNAQLDAMEPPGIFGADRS